MASIKGSRAEEETVEIKRYTEARKRRWYMQEAERIITEGDKDLLQEILSVRNAACALYAGATLQLREDFPDTDVVNWLDNQAGEKRAWDSWRERVTDLENNREDMAQGMANLRKVLGEMREALERIASDFETDFVLDGEIVDDPYRGYVTAWRVARAALLPASQLDGQKEGR